MSGRKGPPPIVYMLAGLLLAGGGWYFFRNSDGFRDLTRHIPGIGSGTSDNNPSPISTPLVTETGDPSAAPTDLPTASDPATNQAGTTPANNLVAALETTLPNPAVIRMDGSVTMVGLTVGLKAIFTQQNPTVALTYGVPDGQPRGSNSGMQALLNGEIELAATSRPLNATEIQAGIRAIPVARDALAVVVGADNPYQGGLSMEQLADIFRGRITNWNQVGGPDRSIRVLNRSLDSGTHSLFQDLVLLGQPFAPDGPSFITFEQDVTTPILRALQTDGISYTTVAQADNQLTVRIVPINDIRPTDAAAVGEGRYPLSRFVFFAVPTPTSPVVQDLLELVLSSQGQSVVGRSDFLPL
ncbi:MAG: phosphate ABC transporter substrate-binding protein [Synechococcaceae cyanobacterium SM2_3_2]|nr:phosphate ABC transporter substrate-binding protein [Synechococcaceae cyanobacterium SM2_3_2]